MKTLIALLMSGAFVAAEDAPSNIQIDVEYFDVPEAMLTEVLHGPKPPSSGKEWRATANKLVKDAKAKVLAGAGVTTKPGTRATTQSVRETPYATEYDPSKGRAANSPEVPREVTGVDLPTPTSFEVKQVGPTFEVDPVIGADGKTVDLNISAELVWRVGEVVHQEIQKGNEMLATMKQPEFYTAKVTTSVSVRDGSSTLLGVLTPHNDNGDADYTRRILCIASVRLITPD